MARIRSVKPELRTSEVVASWPIEVRYFFVLLWGYLDDKGRGLDVPKTIAGDCFPHDEKVTAATINRWLTVMTKKSAAGKEAPICRYEAAGRRYVHCVNWGEHQRINRPSPSRLPPCPLHEPLSEPLTEPGSEPLNGDSVSGSLYGAAEQWSRGAEEQQRPRSEPPRGQLAAAAAIIIEATQATQAEAEALARWLQTERRPRNLAGLVRTIAETPDLAAMLAEQRQRTTRADGERLIAAARQGPPCQHGDPGGAALHPTTGKPLCPLCRREAPSSDVPKQEDPTPDQHQHGSTT